MKTKNLRTLVTTKLRILHLEDDPYDARLVRDALANSGMDFHITVVNDRAEFVSALERECFDVILADYRLPGFSGLDALSYVRAVSKDLPFIFVSGALGEEKAVETLRNGATDYLLKDRLHRLAPALGRAVAEVEAKAISQQTELELQQSEQRLAMAANAAKVGLFEWDPTSGEMQWTAQQEAILGYPPTAATTTQHDYRDWASRVHPDDLAWVKALLRRSVSECKSFAADYRLVWPDGSIHWVTTQGQVIADLASKSTRIMGTIMEITDRKRAEEALRKAKDELELRVNERTAELRRTVSTLQEEVINRMQAEAALQERSAKLQALAAELTLTEQRERRRLAHVLHDGLQQTLVGVKLRLNQVAPLPSHLPPNDLERVVELVDDAIATSQSLTAELSPTVLSMGLVPALEWLSRQVKRKHELHMVLRADPNTEPASEDAKYLLFEAVRELLFNVVKHAGVKTACVEITRQDEQILVNVTDKGVGFSPTQARPAHRIGGFGLFSIRERLGLLGGSVVIDSAPGRGSRITLSVPVSEQKTESTQAEGVMAKIEHNPPSAHPATGAESKIRVLLVDDHAVVREGLARLIQESPDLEIVGEASDGMSAVSQVRELRPDVVLMDICMPGMNGIEATQIIHSELPDIRIIGLSMFESDEQASAMLAAGAVSYLTKSGPPGAVLDCIHA